MEEETYEAILDDIAARNTWASRQAVWYQMRRDGLRRKLKPWPGAADMHYPMVDTAIEKVKPFYINQLFASERLADFISKPGVVESDAEDIVKVAQWFDYQLKQESNLEDEIPLCIDAMLVYGRGILKTYWHTEKKQICFDSIEPAYLIVPGDTTQISEATRLVHVKHLSLWAYKHGPMSENYNQDEDFIKKIRGRPDIVSSAGMDRLREGKKASEGVNYSTTSDCIIAWEIYEKNEKGKWMVETISPQCTTEPIRESFGMPYKHDEAPFVDFTIELTEKSYYAARGVAEILAPFENSMCRMWNEKHDSMSLFNRPVLTSARDIPQTGNIRYMPGQLLPYAISVVPMPAPPISYDQEMNNTRLVAEQRIAVPDFGVSNSKPMGAQSPFPDTKKTATEVEAVMAIGGQVVDMRSRIFRRQLSKAYYQAWMILYQYGAETEGKLGYTQDNESREVTKEMLDAVKTLKPNGSSDAWNIRGRTQRAVTRMSMLKDHPHVDQGELVKSVIELDEPGMVKRLYRDPQLRIKDQSEKQMMEIPALMMGFPISIKPDDDHAIHISVLLQYMVNQAKMGAQPNQQGLAMLQQHLKSHFMVLKEVNPQQAKQLEQQFTQTMMQLQQAGPNGAQGAPAGGQRQIAPQQPAGV